MLIGSNRLHVIAFPTGRHGYVGSIPFALGTWRKATAADVMAGAGLRTRNGRTERVVFPTFGTEAEARTYAEARGFGVAEK